MNNPAQKPLNISVSDTKAQSLHKQVEIISHALNIFCLESSNNNQEALKRDALELVRMLDEIKSTQRKTSRFNVLDKSRQMIAERVTFDQAKQYQDCIVKFAGMEVAA